MMMFCCRCGRVRLLYESVHMMCTLIFTHQNVYLSTNTKSLPVPFVNSQVVEESTKFT